MDCFSIRKNANSLRQQKKYEEAMTEYLKLINERKDSVDRWDCWGYVYCLKQTKRYKEAVKFCSEMINKIENFQQFKNLYAWCLYFSSIVKSNEIDNIENTLSDIVELCKSDFKYSPIKKAILKSSYVFKQNQKHQLIHDYLKIIPHDALEDKEIKIVTSEGKIIFLQSELEQYYSLLSDTELKLKYYEDCVKTCKEALKTIKKFHFNNDIWFSRRIALAKFHLGKFDDSYKYFLTVLKKKKDWFILKETAQTLFSAGKVEKSFVYAVESFLSPGDLDKKVNLIKFLGDLLSTKNENELALICYQLSLLIRNENNWPSNDELNLKISKMSEIKNEIKVDNDKNIICRILKDKLRAIKNNIIPKHKGIISNIIANGKAGFIKMENGNSIYFSDKSVVEKTAELEILQGKNVLFQIVDSYDLKKEKISSEAINIEFSVR